MLFEFDYKVIEEQIKEFYGFFVCCVVCELVLKIFGWWNFWGRDFEIMLDVLDLCFEIEILIDLVFKGLKFVIIFDLGCGSGIIVLIFLVELLEVKVQVSDISQVCLDVIICNVIMFFVLDRFKVIKLNWFSEIEGEFVFIVLNFFYIFDVEMVELFFDVLNYDFYLVFISGGDGFVFYEVFVKGVCKYFVVKGCILVEIGYC